MKNYSDPSVEKLIHSYDFNSLYELFNYILESRTNGQHKQARAIFNMLPESINTERWEFLLFLEYVCDLDVEEWKQYLNYIPAIS